MPEAAYDAIAEWYDQSVRQATVLSGSEILLSTLLQTIGSVEGQTICDLACGQGDLARRLAAQGATVTGIDISLRLLQIARRDESEIPLGITYLQGDAQNLDEVDAAPFDGVVCSLALMDIPDLDATIGTVQRLLRLFGWFVVSITHPCFQIPPTRSYFDEGFWRSDNPDGVRGKVGANHRTLATYLNALSKAGLLLENVHEPRLPGRETPPILVLQCRKHV